MYILYQNFLKKSIKLRKTQFEYLTLHQEHGLEYAAAGVCSPTSVKEALHLGCRIKNREYAYNILPK